MGTEWNPSLPCALPRDELGRDAFHRVPNFSLRRSRIRKRRKENPNAPGFPFHVPHIRSSRGENGDGVESVPTECAFVIHAFGEFCHVRLMRDIPPLDPIPGRKKPAGGVKVLLWQPTIVLLSVCAKDRKPWIAQRAVQESLEEIWRKADAWLVGSYLLMPDHLHLFCAPRDLHFTIEQWLTFWKREFSRKHLTENWAWQRNGFHHRLREHVSTKTSGVTSRKIQCARAS